MRRLDKAIELPEDEGFSDGLRALVSHTLTPDAKIRPSMQAVLEHEYVANTENSHPTTILSELVKNYYAWLYGGGQRTSLFMPGGAAVPSDFSGATTTSDQGWNFSLTESCQNRLSTIFDMPDFSEFSDLPHLQHEGESTPKRPTGPTPSFDSEALSSTDKANFEERVKRGADLGNIFDQEKPQYEYKAKSDFIPVTTERRVSDLPFRAMVEDRPSSIASNVIDMGDFDSEDYAAVPQTKQDTIKLADAATIKAVRGTSKLYRDSPSSSAEDLPSGRTPSGDDQPVVQVDAAESLLPGDFSFPPKEWRNEEGKGRLATTDIADEAAAEQSAVRKTMDWSFSSAMSQAGTQPVQVFEEAETSPLQGPSKKPALLRTTTQPVTVSELEAASDVVEPPTANSDAFSDLSVTQSDIDPFAFDDAPQAIMEALDDLNISGFYATEGNYVFQDTLPTVPTVQGAMPYPLGQPARPGEHGSFGSGTAMTPQQSQRQTTTTGRARETDETAEEERVTVTLPEIRGPSREAMDSRASPDVVANELSGLLRDMGEMLSATGGALNRLPRRPRRRQRRALDSEWEDEE